MITIDPFTNDDGAEVAALWNASRLNAASCWYGAEVIDDTYAGLLLASGFELALARQDGSPVGFGFWCGPAAMPRLVALAAEQDEVYYRLMAAFCDWGIAGGAPSGYAELGTAPTLERGRMDALAVIDYTPIGFEPLLPGQDPDERMPRVLRAECNLQVLKAAVLAKLETLT